MAGRVGGPGTLLPSEEAWLFSPLSCIHDTGPGYALLSQGRAGQTSCSHSFFFHSLSSRGLAGIPGGGFGLRVGNNRTGYDKMDANLGHVTQYVLDSSQWSSET